MTTTRTRFPATSWEFGDRVGHRDLDTWGRHVPGRVVAVDVHQGRPRVRVHPTYRHGPEWEAHPDDLVRVGRNPQPARYGYRRAATDPPRDRDRDAPDRTIHHHRAPGPMVVDVYEPHPHHLRRRRPTADRIRWAVPDQGPPRGTPQR
ncbi:hypothetical protein [Streptomyces sp. SID3343]|uniref:hypothetical protein n=1 Tax=Streptomyces sp. SID3343 TaxID=2690260 RepID=UPI00136FA194|nr:hypothetical protein [Streptomyces sp. SID3343]MYV99697.1 hypothetical protein [Streptomyces sp. SID3343]